MKVRIAATCAVLVLSAAGAYAYGLPDVPTSTDTLMANQIIVALGNSITELGESPRGYVSVMRTVLNLLQPEKNIIIVNSGIGGHKSTDMEARFDRDVLAFQPDWVTISVGINDVWHGFDDAHPEGGGPNGVPLPEFRARVSAMVAKAQAHHIRVALFTTTVIQENLHSPENAMLVDYNNVLREIAAQFHCLLIDQNKAFHEALAPYQHAGMASSGVFTVDGVHMLPDGDWLMARTALIGFGISRQTLDGMRDRISQALGRNEELREDDAAVRNTPRALFFGSPLDSDRFQNLDVADRYLVTASARGESLRQCAARLKGTFLQNNVSVGVLFLDGCSDFRQGGDSAPKESALAFSKVLQLADQYHAKLAVVAPSGGQQDAGRAAWVRDTCKEHNVDCFDLEVTHGSRADKLLQWTSAVVGRPLLGVSFADLFLTSFTAAVQPLFVTGVVRFTLDGSDPGESSPAVTGPIDISSSVILKARQYSSGGGSSAIREEPFHRAEYKPPATPGETSPGLAFSSYEGAWDRLPDFDSVRAINHGVVSTVELSSVSSLKTHWGAVFTGFLNVPTDGMYTFYLRSDDGSRLIIDGATIADNDGLHGSTTVPGKAALKAGMHNIKVLFFQREGGEFLSLQWKSSTLPRQDVPKEAYRH